MAESADPPNSPVSDEERLKYFGAWLRLGTAKRAVKRFGDAITPHALSNWKARHPKLWEQSVKAHEAALQDLRQSIAHLTAKGLHAGAARAEEELASGRPLEPRDLAQLIRALSDIDGQQDRIWRLNRELPTDIVEDRSDAEALAALREELRELGVDVKGTVLEGLPESPRPSLATAPERDSSPPAPPDTTTEDPAHETP